MAGDIIVYSKDTGNSPVPLTIRVEWLPDGTINPLMFRTDDGACLNVTTIIERIPLTFLKERGAGLRFKVMAEVVETQETGGNRQHSQYETYLYLADRRFFEKNIIDERYGHPGKEYIPVTLDIFPDGSYELVHFWVHGMRYLVERTFDVQPRGSYKAGGAGLWHKVEARLVNADDDEDPNPAISVKRSAALYLELNKWFIYVA